MQPLTFSAETESQLLANTGFEAGEILELARIFQRERHRGAHDGPVHHAPGPVECRSPDGFSRTGLFGGASKPVSTLWQRVDRELVRHFRKPMLTQLHRRYDLSDPIITNAVYLPS